MGAHIQVVGWLGFAIILGVIQLLSATMLSTAQRGFKWNMSSRDTPAPQLAGKAARLDRAFKNFMETFPFFVAAVLIAIVNYALSNSSSTIPVLGSQIYVIARALYVPAYVFNLIGLRTLIWFVSMIGIGLILLGGLQLI